MMIQLQTRYNYVWDSANPKMQFKKAIFSVWNVTYSSCGNINPTWAREKNTYFHASIFLFLVFAVFITKFDVK
jgi:hypothetical protein